MYGLPEHSASSWQMAMLRIFKLIRQMDIKGYKMSLLLSSTSWIGAR